MKKDKLVILWTSGDPDMALNMVLMYALKANTNKWWRECVLITWGPSNRLVCEHKEIKTMVREIMAQGVRVMACQRCAERYGLVGELSGMGIEVKLMGEPLTEYLQDDDWRILSV